MVGAQASKAIMMMMMMMKRQSPIRGRRQVTASGILTTLLLVCKHVQEEGHHAYAFSTSFFAGQRHRGQQIQIHRKKQIYSPLCDTLHDLRGGAHLQSSTSVEDTSTTAATFPSSILPDIHVQESQINQPLDETSTVILAVRTIADPESDSGISGCEGYLVDKSNLVYEAHLSSDLDSGEVDQVIAVFHKLLLQYLSIEYEVYEMERDEGLGGRIDSQLKIVLGGEGDVGDSTLMHQLERIGMQLHANNGGLNINLAKYIPYLNEFAFQHRGTEQGNTALEVLQMLSQRRISFDFTKHQQSQEVHSTTTNATSTRNKNVVSHQKQVLPSSAVDDVMDIVEEIKSRKWLSDNPDSVDGLPSLHLNLISNGKPLFDKSDNDDDEDTTTTFRKCISSMIDVLQPHLYDTLLPAVRKITNSSTVEISDVFIRNYGKINEDESIATRYGLSTHYDVTASATCVMTLDSTASTGRNGLYTILPTEGTGSSSSHAALRTFFPLEKGDGVVHTYDVLHGVDVDPELNRARTSLIVWFTDSYTEDDTGNCKETEQQQQQTLNQPWLLNPTDDIGEFVLGLASESAVEEDSSHLMLKNAVDQYSLYLSSARRGNIFAMSSLAQMCNDDRIPDLEYDQMYNVLKSRDEHNPFLPNEATVLANKDGGDCSRKELANALRYHAAIQGGHRVAQISLADAIMLQYMANTDGMKPAEQESMLLMATTLFTMALVQGSAETRGSLERLMGVECNRLSGMGIDVPSEEFHASPVVQSIIRFI